MSEVQESWREVVSKTEALGRKLKLHLDHEEGAEQPTAEPGAAADTGSDAGAAADTGSDAGAASAADGTGGTAADTRAALEDLGHRLQEAFESFGAAAKDPSVRTEVKDIGLALKDAFVVTLTTVSSEVTDAVKKASGRAQDALESDSEPEPADTVAPETAPAPDTDQSSDGSPESGAPGSPT